MIGHCPTCGSYNHCGCKACTGRNGITGREDIFTQDGEGSQCWFCGAIFSADELLDWQFSQWRLGQTLGIYEASA